MTGISSRVVVRSYIGLSVAVMLGCGSSVPTPPDTPPPTPTAKRVNFEEFPDNWPLKIMSGELECLDGKALVFHGEDGKTHALNEAAEAKYEKIETIATDEGKNNLNVLTEAALKLCK